MKNEDLKNEQRLLLKTLLPTLKKLGVNYSLIREQDTPIPFVIFLNDFGGKHGLGIDVIGSGKTQRIYRDRLVPVSMINVKAYVSGGEALIIESLRDWGYFGAEDQVPQFLRSTTQ